MTKTTATLLTAQQMGSGNKLPYTPRHINEYLKDRVFIQGIHYVRLPGTRKILYVWEAIERDFVESQGAIQMANGGFCHG